MYDNKARLVSILRAGISNVHKVFSERVLHDSLQVLAVGVVEGSEAVTVYVEDGYDLSTAKDGDNYFAP